MPETKTDTAQGKSKSIFSIAKEVNRQSTEVLDYLKRIGIEVSGIMSKVDETVYRKVLGHFKSDIEEAVKHKQKLIDFKKKHKTIEINEIEEDVKKERERKLQEEEERKEKLEAEEKLKRERELHLQRELDEKRRLIEMKKEQLEREKELEKEKELERRRQLEAEKKRKEEEAQKPKEKVIKIPAEKPTAKKVIPVPAERKPPFKPKREPEKPAQFQRNKEEQRPRYEDKADKQAGKTERKYEKVVIKEDYKKRKKPQQGYRQRPFFKKPAQHDEKERIPVPKEKQIEAIPVPESLDAKKRDIERKNKIKKQKYTDGAEAKKRKKYDDEALNIEIEEAIRETMAKIEDVGALTSRSQLRKRKRKERIEQEQKQQEEFLRSQSILQVTEFLSTAELASLMNIDVNLLIQKSLELGMMISINQRLEKDLIVLLADEFGYKVDFHKEYEVDLLADTDDPPETLVSRPPVVTIMGHVDHGKTSLLDYIRKTNVVAGEAGGITQHIGAYQVSLDSGKLITFLDTPGHEAFTAMRARGAQITDIVVLVVAADDNVMPQTIEAINHSLAANVPIVIAINKIDKPNADPLKIKTQLSDKGILVEEWGGKYQSVEIAAKKGLNIDKLLEKILLEAELLDLKANPHRNARGAVVEAELDKGKGILASILVQKGTLKMGDSFVAGVFSGKVKAMYDERGNRVETAKPSTPVQVSGFDGMPQAGDTLVVLNTERDTKEISLKRQQLKREQDFRQIKFTTLDDISKQIKEGKQVDLNVIIKGDVDGSVEALSDSLLKLGTSEVKVSVIHKGIGEISENDVLLAAASNAIIVGFSVRPNLKARKLAQSEKVDIRLHNIIYDVINEIKLALEGLLEPEKSEEVLATVEVRQTFKVPKVGLIAGCYVLDGKVVRSSKVRLLREGFTVFDGNILSLKRFKDDVREVEAGYECGISLENFNDIKVGDIIESYKIVEIKRKLA
ncbi:MAG: translation initiation factor IF-2 [Ignavibacteria bacterium]|jgi:translation initiation factor IF-2